MNLAEKMLNDYIPSSANGSRIDKQKALEFMKVLAEKAHQEGRENEIRHSNGTQTIPFELWFEEYKPVETPEDNIVTMPRYFVDLRVGCAAVRDRWHETYDVEYYGLNADVPDVIKYVNGVNNNGWEVRKEDVNELIELCDKLNEINDKIHN